MEPPSDPNSNPPPPSEPGSGPFSADYWNTSLYGSNQPAPDQPFGIGWDHPVFQGGSHSAQQQQQPQQQQPQPQHRDLFAHPPRGWQQQNSVPPVMGPPEPQQNFHMPTSYRVGSFRQSPIQQQAPFDPPPQQGSSPYNPFQFDQQSFYPNSPLPAQSGFVQHQRPTAAMQVNQSPVLAPTSMENNGTPSYDQHPSLQPNLPANAVRFPGFQDQHARPGFHHTINPQFLTGPQHQMISHGHAHQQPVVVNPADLQTRSYQPYGGITTQPPSVAPQYLAPAKPKPETTKTQNGVLLDPKLEKPVTSRKKKDVATKASKTQAKKDGGKPANNAKSAAQPGDSSSGSDYSDTSDEEEPEKSPLPAQRPQDVEGGIKYDTLKAVWSPRNKQPLASQVRDSMMAFSDLVKSIRDTWKSRSETLKAAENQNQEDKIPAIKRQVILQRRLLDLVINTTLESGHPFFVRRYGEHPIIVSAFYSFLLDRHNAADSDGPLTVNILKIMTKFTSMEQAMLEKTKNDKMLARFVKKGGDTIKRLAKSILDNAAAVTKKKQEIPKGSSKENTPPRRTSSPDIQVVIRNSPKLPASGIKRSRESDSSEPPMSKRVVAPTNPANGKAAAKPGATTVAKKNPIPPSQNGKPAQNQANVPAKPKANMITPKPTPNLFSSLMSASKKPGTSNAARAAAAAKEKASAEQKPTPSQPPAAKPAFSFSATMADLSKPREPTPTKPVEETPPETEEERAKRLRKEERRKLRVTWKPDDSLTEVRFFTHDPEEEIGHEDSMMRDVGDVAGEGRMLKLHHGLDDLDDEEERDETFFPYTTPSEIDLDPLGEERYRNYTKTGGQLHPNSPERLAQEQREATTLSVFYTSPADVPFSPKEPPPPSPSEPYDPEVPFGELDDQTKARSDKYFAARAPPAPPQAPQAPQQPPNPASSGADISSLLKMLQGNNQQQQQQQSQQPQQPTFPQANISDLEKTFNQFRGPSASQAPATTPVSQPGQAAPAQNFDLQRILTLMNSQNQMQQPPVVPPAAPTQGPNLASILAQFSNPSGQQQQQQSQPYGQGHNQRPHHEDPGRKRNYDGGGRYDGSDEGSHAYHKRFRVNGDPSKPKKHPKAGLVPCRYWKEGKCLKGEDCTFRHDPLD